MFNLDQFLTSTVCDVNATDIRFQDARTGEVFTKTIFRPGRSINFKRLGEEMAHYGYTLLWIGDPGNIPGRMNWSDVFGKFIQEEGTND